MPQIFILAFILTAAFPIAVIYLLISNSKLKTRIAAIEKNIADRPAQASRVSDKQRFAVTPKSEPTTTVKSTPVRRAAQPDAIHTPTRTAPPEIPPKTFVISQEKIDAFVSWLTQNWFYVAAAASLGLAGIFLTLYGMEQGLLPPFVRILSALAFGAAFIGAGEYIRRRYGDDEKSTTAFLPSTFSGAGVVTLFGAVLSARLLYGFIGPEMALFGMALIGLLAMVLGWFYGPLLAAVGVIGSMIAPFVVGGSSEDPSLLLMYFAIITVMGLAIDSMQRWAWVSVISLVTGFGAGTLLMLGAGDVVKVYFEIFCLALALVAIAIPVRKLVPDHTGTSLSITILARSKDDPWPEFPTRLACGAVIAASALILFAAMWTSRIDLFWAGILMLSGLVLALLVWAKNAPALVDLTIVPAIAIVALVASGADLWATYKAAALLPEANMPKMATTLVAIAVLLSIAAAWRSLRGGASQLFTALGAALFAPAVAIAIEVMWSPVQILGGYAWALHAMVIGAVMVAMAERFARIDGAEHRERASFAVLSALACITFGVVILLSSAALTTAIALTIVAAAWLDKRFKMPLMGVYIFAGVTAVGYRLVADPGIEWAASAPLLEMLLSHAGAVVAFVASYVLVKAAKRPKSEILLESAVFSATGILISLLLYRSIISWGGVSGLESHWALGIGATVWISLGIAQLRRLEIGGRLAKIRLGLGALFLFSGAFQLMLAVFLFNPLFDAFGTPVLGPSLINSLIPAYLLPAGVLAFGVWWIRAIPRPYRIGAGGIALALAGLWLVLAIRHFWRGAEAMQLPGIEQAELYSYTVVLLLIGAGLFYQSLARPSALLRKAGLLFIGLAVVKVFFLDIRGLGGLIRVFAFLFLGLSLSGLAWLNRWAAVRIDPSSKETDE